VVDDDVVVVRLRFMPGIISLCSSVSVTLSSNPTSNILMVENVMNSSRMTVPLASRVKKEMWLSSNSTNIRFPVKEMDSPVLYKKLQRMCKLTVVFLFCFLFTERS